MSSHESFDSEYAKLAACAARREENGGVCDDTEACDIGWCADCREAIQVRREKQDRIRQEARQAFIQGQGRTDPGTPAYEGKHARARRGARIR